MANTATTPMHEPEYDDMNTAYSRMRKETPRSQRLLWPIGEPEAEGYQRYVVLHTTHHKGSGYRAYLSQTLIKREERVTSEKYTLIGRVQVMIYDEAAPRFSAKKLERVQDSARRNLVTLFGAGEQSVLEQFARPVADRY